MIAYVCDRCAKKIEADKNEALQGWKRLIVNDLVTESGVVYIRNNERDEIHLCPACYKRIYEF